MSPHGTPNPLLAPWTTPHETPPFAAIQPEHFRAAFDHAMAEHLAEIEAIAAAPEAPTFDNTIAALERSGRALTRVSAVFHALAGAHTNDALMAIEREMSPRLAAHRNRIRLHDGLYSRITALRDRRDSLGLSPEEARVLERYDTTFRRAGAGLPPDARSRIAAIEMRLATLGTTFSQNVLADEQAYVLFLDGEEDLAGLDESARTAAAAAATERGEAGRHAITLARSSVEPFLRSSARRDLRERAYEAWAARGNSGFCRRTTSSLRSPQGRTSHSTSSTRRTQRSRGKCARTACVFTHPSATIRLPDRSPCRTP